MDTSETLIKFSFPQQIESKLRQMRSATQQQRTLAMMTGFEQYTKKARRALFLEEMEQVVPWRELCGPPHYPKPGKGRPPVGVERMLRIYFLQQWFNLSEPAVEEALYDSAVMRQFVDMDLGVSRCPTKPQCASFGTCWKNTNLGNRSWGR
jgi:transposase, IS5 family